MKHKFKIIAFITALTLSLSGCFPTGENQPPSNGSETAQPFSGRVSEKYGDVELNYEIPADLPTKLPLIQLKLKDYDEDEERIKSVMFRGKTEIKKEGYVDWVHFASDGSFLQIGKQIKFIEGGTANELKHYELFATIWSDFCRAGGEQLSAFSSAEATERGNKLLDELGIKNYAAPSVITVTPKMANEVLALAFKKEVTEDSYSDTSSEHIPWTEDDGLYILKYQLNYNGVDLCDCGTAVVGADRGLSDGSYITIGVTKDGITSLTAQQLYDVVSLDAGNADFKFDAKYASDQLAEHYSKITEVPAPIFFYKCKAEYIPYKKEEGTVIFAPAWCIMGRAYDKEDPMSLNDISAYYYADSGRRYGG